MATSFISEHSAEYVLVNRLITFLTEHFSRIIPIYFLATREGSKIARLCRPTQSVRVLNVFARRPKVDTPGQTYIEIKLNESLFETAELSNTLGISTFAGVPLLSSILDFVLDVDCIWFKLSGAHKDVYYKISLQGIVLSQSSNSETIQGPLSKDSLIQGVLDGSRLMDWDEALNSLRTIRRVTRANKTWFMFGAGYHPFNLIVFDK